MTFRRLVITADDFGIGQERDAGIAECFRAGVVTRASLLVNGVSMESAVRLAKDIDMPMGLHLNLTEGTPISDRESVPSLLGRERYFLGKMGFREALKAGRVELSQVKQEIDAQIVSFKQHTGSLPRHVDGHQHVHVLPGVVDVFASVLDSHKITWTRLPVENMEAADWLQPTSKTFCRTVLKDSLAAKQILKSQSIRFTDSYAGMVTMGDNMNISRLKSSLSEVFSLGQTLPTYTGTSHPDRSVSCELMVHPGYRCLSENGGCGDGPDDFTKSVDREHEMSVLRDGELLQFYKDNNIKLAAFPE